MSSFLCIYAYYKFASRKATEIFFELINFTEEDSIETRLPFTETFKCQTTNFDRWNRSKCVRVTN